MPTEDSKKLSYDTLPIACFVFDANFRIVDCNRDAAELFGYARSELEGCSVFELLVAENERGELESRWAHQAALADRFEHTGQNITRSGNSIWCRWKLGVGRTEAASWRITAVVEDVTLEQRALQDTTASEVRFRTLIEEAPIAIGIHRGGIGIYSNRAHHTLFGYPSAELIVGMPLLGLVAPESRDVIADRLKRRELGEVVETACEFTALRTDGTRFPALTSVLPVTLPDGPATITFFTDLTEVRSAEMLNQRIVQTAAEGIWVIDVNERTRFVNRRMCEMLGYTEEEIRSAPARTFMEQSTVEEFEDHLHARREGKSSTREAVFRRKDGRRLWVSVSGAPLQDAEGRFEGTFGMFTDITHRKLAEASLRDTEERFRAVLEQASIGFDLVEVDGSILEWNHALARISGVSRTDAVGQKIWDIQSKLFESGPGQSERASKYRAFFERAAKTGDSGVGSKPSEIELRLPDGSSRHVLQVVYPMQVDDGFRFGQVFWDVSDARRAEEANRQAEARLRQSQKMEALGTLAGGVAHDFNNILAAIVGFTQVVYEDIPDRPESRDDLAQVLVACRRAKDLVQQILAFSRRAPQEQRPLNIGTVVREAARLLRSTLPAKIEIECNVSEELLPVMADATQMHQVMMNLCTNSAHAMSHGPGKLVVDVRAIQLQAAHLRGHASMQPGLHCLLSVADTGTGMDSRTLARIFEPFFTTKAPGEGTGLGLSAVHGIVAEHGGFIDVESQLGKGTTFRVYLPFASANAAQASTESAQLPMGQGQRILVVDDEIALCKWLHRMLTRLGYRPQTTVDPNIAFEMIREEPTQFALLITDQNMPNMTGSELVMRVRQVSPNMPVVLTTGYGAELSAERMAALGICGLIEKPATVSQVAQIVYAALGAQ